MSKATQSGFLLDYRPVRPSFETWVHCIGLADLVSGKAPVAIQPIAMLGTSTLWVACRLGVGHRCSMRKGQSEPVCESSSSSCLCSSTIRLASWA